MQMGSRKTVHLDQYPGMDAEAMDAFHKAYQLSVVRVVHYWADGPETCWRA